MTAKQRYDILSSDRSQYLNIARQASELTIPYLVHEDDNARGARNLVTPWQSVGAKGVVTLAAKLMLSLLPPQTSFFKLQVDESKLGDFGPEVKSELDLAFAKVERTILEQIAASDDRVVVHQAMKHLVVSGNALIFMGKEGLKLFPLNRYVIDRDGNGNVIEIVTKESINKQIVQDLVPELQVETINDDTIGGRDECDVYTHVTVRGKKVNWHQEVYDQIIPKSDSKAQLDVSPWLPLRFNTVDGEGSYGRGRVEEFLGDLKSLEALSQALVEGSAAAAKVVFTVSPSSSTKPATLASAGNGAIIQGRPDDIGVVQVGKTADFGTAYSMMQQLEKRLSEAFLILSVRNSERTTAEEVRMTQMELEQQLGGLFSLLTVEFLVPYLDRKLNVLQKDKTIPPIPRDVVKPTIVAGINALGRGQDRESLGMFLQTIAQTIGPEAIMRFINPDEVIKRLAAASGIDVLNLVKSMQEQQGEQQRQMQRQAQMEQVKQGAAMAAVEQKQMQAEMQMAMQAEQQQQPQQPPR